MQQIALIAQQCHIARDCNPMVKLCNPMMQQIIYPISSTQDSEGSQGQNAHRYADVTYLKWTT